ncbi:PAS domain-containing sensor histidine kinase [Pelotalea chapellei]|uniref:histidine kinase n=1 Tax=Pelotalea chapellei TaxID=44671 RepID=A0ABS5UAZ6_9BACT|nr:PAS domain S-box protein [Pelotalea chapellei]MBT1072839.1 PAS domain S-box protein [Pelotalea chapellei]
MVEKDHLDSHQLRQTRALKQAILDSLPAHIAVIDKQGIIVIVNGPWKRFAEENGVPWVESVCVGADYVAVCKRAAEVADPLAKEALEGIQSVLQGQLESFSLEYPCHSPDQNRWFLMTVVDPHYNALGAIISHINITERKYWEETLLQSEKKFTTIFQNVPALLGITVLADGALVEVNDTFLRVTGYERDEVIGRTTVELGIWDNPDDRKTVLEILSRQGSVHDLEFRFRTKNGDLLIGLISVELIELKGEKHILTMLKDITERKRMEENIQELNQELATHAKKLEALNLGLSAFNYTVSHDLKTPLNRMILRVQMIEQLYGDQLNEECKKDLHAIFDGVMQMNDLITTLMDFSNCTCTDLQRENIDLSLIAREVAGDLSLSEAGRNVQFDIATGVMVNCDPKLARIVLVNLLGNAWKYTSNQEQVIIEFGVRDIEGSSFCFVRDNGPGFDESEAEKLFIPFHRLPGTEEHKGHGIGLATVERIVARHGGRVWAESPPGNGAVFYFSFE